MSCRRSQTKTSFDQLLSIGAQLAGRQSHQQVPRHTQSSSASCVHLSPLPLPYR